MNSHPISPRPILMLYFHLHCGQPGFLLSTVSPSQSSPTRIQFLPHTLDMSRSSISVYLGIRNNICWNRTALFCVITQGEWVVSIWRFGSTYRSHRQRAILMGQTRCPDASVNNYHYQYRSNPEDKGFISSRRTFEVTQHLLKVTKHEADHQTVFSILMFLSRLFSKCLPQHRLFNNFSFVFTGCPWGFRMVDLTMVYTT